MIRCPIGLLALGVLSVGQPVLAAEPGPLPVAVYQGLLQIAPYGELVTCDGPVLLTRLSYVAMPGVCDDLGDQPCAGRLVAELERCALGNVALAAGDLAGGYSRNLVRFCFEPEPQAPGVAMCNDHNRVGLGSWIGAGRAAQSDSVLEATAVLRLQRARQFLADGRWVRLSREPQTQHFSQQRSVPGPGSCALAPQQGCGVIGVGVN